VVDVHLIDATTGTIVLSETAEGKADTKAVKILNIGEDGTYDETLAGKALRAAIEKLVDRIVDKMTTVAWEGYVLRKEASSVWMTGGEDVGIRRGMAFRVSTPPQAVTAPSGKTYFLPGTEKGTVAVEQVLADVDKEALPLMNKAGKTLDEVNVSLVNVGEITKDVSQMTDKVDRMAGAVEGAVTAPARKAAAFSAGVSEAVGSFFKRGDEEGAPQ